MPLFLSFFWLSPAVSPPCVDLLSICLMFYLSTDFTGRVHISLLVFQVIYLFRFIFSLVAFSRFVSLSFSIYLNIYIFLFFLKGVLDLDRVDGSATVR